jgi:hypothetical protein
LIRRAEDQARRKFNAPYAKIFLADEVEEDVGGKKDLRAADKAPTLRLCSLKEAWGIGIADKEVVQYYSPLGTRGGIAGQCGASQAMLFRKEPSNDLHYNGNVDLDSHGLSMYTAPIKSFMDERNLVGVLQIALPHGFEPEEDMLRNRYMHV